MKPGSHKLYHRAWAVFRDFAHRFYQSSSPQFPLNPNRLALFILSHLSARQLAPSTIASYISAISYVHKLKGFSDPTNSFLIRKLLTAVNCRRQSDIRLPISRPVLHELVRSLRFTKASAFQQTLYKAIFLLAFYGFFHIGELAAKSARSVSTVVKFSALRFLISNGKPHFLKLVISEYKHNINKRPFEILIAREDCPAQFCPVQALLEYLALRGNRPGPLFCHCSLAPITADQFNTQLHRCLSFCGLETRRYKGHRFRLGAASHAADKGFSDTQIRTLGRWQSDAFKVYIRLERLCANEVDCYSTYCVVYS